MVLAVQVNWHMACANSKSEIRGLVGSCLFHENQVILEQRESLQSKGTETLPHTQSKQQKAALTL